MTIKKKYDAVIKELSAMSTYPWENKDFYAAWLCQSYHYTSRGSQILLMGAAHCNEKQKPLQYRLHKHAGEERGHEVLASRDLQDLGYKSKEIGEFAVTQAFYATQFYKLQNISVEPLMGFILPLEGIAVEFGKTIRDRVAKVDFPTRFLDIHVDEDPDHVEKAFKVAETLTPEMQVDTMRNMEVTRDLYLGILNECKLFAEKRVTKTSRKAS